MRMLELLKNISIQDTLSIFNYGLILLYGILLSVHFCGGTKNHKEKWSVFGTFLLILVVQIICFNTLGLDFTKKLYPLISHFPLYLSLRFILKKKRSISLVSILTAYFCCQLPRFIGMLVSFFLSSKLSYEISYLLVIIPLFIVLDKYFTKAAYSAMTYSLSSLWIFGGLPLIYYLFDYSTTVYTDILYSGIRLFSEFFPAAMAMFYLIFISAYHYQVQKSMQLQMQSSLLTLRLEQSESDISALWQLQEQTATYRHDMRHHMNIINQFLQSGDIEEAKQYITNVQKDIELITPKRYCQNTTVNLILSTFAEKARRFGVTLDIEVSLPSSFGLNETELCALLSNGLENAINAASSCISMTEKKVQLNCKVYKDKLMIFLSNPYIKKVIMKNGLPENSEAGHGFGVKSIKMITEAHNGFCTFEVSKKIFTLKVIIPIN